MADKFLKLETPSINGDSTVTGHTKEIEIESWAASSAQPAAATRSSAGGATVEHAAHQPMQIVKRIDSATADLLKNHWNGKTIGKATLTIHRPSGATETDKSLALLQVVMEDVIISSYSISAGGNDMPYETLTLDYGTIQYTYGVMNADGSAGGNKPAKHDLIKRVIS